MSRTEFRQTFRSPRPRSALAMVAIATMTLAITEQVAPSALLWTACCAAVTAWQRDRIHRWQERGWILNAGLLFCLAIPTALFVRGQLAVIALAHFAVLTQGLQLLDQRPRRSEFLLVALAVFQVILAANLTDHAAFPLLLIAFTVSVVWTLTVHTLRAEALEAGEPDLAGDAVSWGLMRTTAAASLLSIGLAIFLFPMLPRIRSGAFISQGVGSPMAMSGFSENVELGDLGRIRLDPAVVLRVEPVEGGLPPADTRYWRGLAFDRFDGRRWSITPAGRTSLKGDPEIGLDFGTPRRGAQQRQRVTREKLESGVLFTPGLATVIRGDVGRVQTDQGGSLYGLHTAGDRIDYQIAADVRTPYYLDLRDQAVELPRLEGERYLQLPELDPGVSSLAQKIVAETQTDLERVLALEAYLQRSGRYTNDVPNHERDGRSPIESFLLERTEAHCEYFASGMVVMARSLGIPTRLVNGFAGGATNTLGGFVEVTQSDAHTWVEVHFEDSGWVRFDPTPADLRLAGAAELRGERWWANVGSAFQLWWYRVVDFDRSSQGRGLRKAWLAYHRWRGERRAEAADGPKKPAGDWGFQANAAWWLVGLSGLVGLAWLWSRRQKQDLHDVPVFYRQALRLLAAKGRVRAESATARSFAADLSEELSPVAFRAFDRLTEAYLLERFAGVPGGKMEPELQALREHLH